jgi:preprotein translocase subunit SecG
VGVLTAVFNTLIVLTSLFLIFLVLIQRGKGGGLAGAFGGVGGSSAFGTKAGDTFTRVTVITASIWILMAMLLVVLTSRKTDSAWRADASTSLSRELGSSSSKGKSKKPTSASTPPSKAPSGSAGKTGAPLPAEKVPAIPESTTFPQTPGSVPTPK